MCTLVTQTSGQVLSIVRLCNRNDAVHTDGVVPYDGIPIKQFVAVALPVTIVYVFLASVGIILPVPVLSSITYTERKSKANSNAEKVL